MELQRVRHDSATNTFMLMICMSFLLGLPETQSHQETLLSRCHQYLPLVKFRVSPQPSSSLTFHYHSIPVFTLSYGKLCTWLLEPHGHWLPCWLLLILLSGIFLRGHPLERPGTLITVENSRGKTAVLKSCIRKFGKYSHLHH